MKKDDLKLCYVLKIGYKSNGKGLYEFIFSKNPSEIDTASCGWNESPASGNANPPEAEHIDLILSLETNKIDLICLHELHDRAYSDGYYTIHCLAYENIESDNHDPLYEEVPLLVFHYGMKTSEVKDYFLSRDITMKEITPEKSIAIESTQGDNEEDEVLEEDED